jgi:hypothetical protein
MLAAHAVVADPGQGPQLHRAGHDRLAGHRVALLGHGAAADGAGRHGLFDLAELLLHEGVDFPPDLAAGGGQHAQQRHILRLMIPKGTGRHGHRPHAESPRQFVLRRQADHHDKDDRASPATQPVAQSAEPVLR